MTIFKRFYVNRVHKSKSLILNLFNRGCGDENERFEGLLVETIKLVHFYDHVELFCKG